MEQAAARQRASHLEAEDFLDIVHGDRKGWLGLPAKVGKYWVEFSTEWPGDGVVTRRIDTCLRDREDLYYSAALFRQKGRKIEDAMGSHWLWADLDEVHPVSAREIGYLPTLAIESSPGRYQALWRLTRELPPKSLEKLNRALSYALDADRGGWDLTQVLRLPGTRNFKYPEAPMVTLLWYGHDDLHYDPDVMWADLKKMLPAGELRAAVSVDIPRRGISARARVLLRTPAEAVVSGERSSRLWELECLLAEAGLGVDEIHGLVWNTAWNKWRSVHSGRVRLEKEILKAIKHVGRQHALRQTSKKNEGPTPDATTAGLPFRTYASFMSQTMEEPKWLVEDIWAADSHGIIGGEPKTAKTTLALALGLAVASGKPFLGKYPVPGAGPVLFVQEENAPWMMQDRLRKLAWFYGLIRPRAVHERRVAQGDLARKGSVVVGLDFPDDVPFRLLNNYGFDLAEDEHTDGLWKACDEFRPKLVILDPLYLILGDADSDRVVHLRPFLKWLLKLRMEFGCSVILVHHMRKRNLNGQAVVRAGQNLLGSAILHGWVDSALYLHDQETERKGWKSVRVEREFRSMAPQRAIEIDLSMGEPGGLEMRADISNYDLAGLIASRVKEEPGITVNALAAELEMDKRTLLSRVRGDEDHRVRLESGARGRGQTHKLYAT